MQQESSWKKGQDAWYRQNRHRQTHRFELHKSSPPALH
ncbi:MAG: DUF2396 family protein [Treponema sp.]|nr:DUF2396 family protein [Treponema sp.]